MRGAPRTLCVRMAAIEAGSPSESSEAATSGVTYGFAAPAAVPAGYQTCSSSSRWSDGSGLRRSGRVETIVVSQKPMACGPSGDGSVTLGVAGCGSASPCHDNIDTASATAPTVTCPPRRGRASS
jgi:hypothetical protein